MPSGAGVGSAGPPSQCSAVVSVTWPLRPHSPRGVTCTSGEPAAGGDGEGLRVGVGPLLQQGLAQLPHGARFGLDEVPGEDGEPVQVDAHESFAELVQLAVAGVLHQRPQGEAVAGGVGVEGRAQGDETGDRPVAIGRDSASGVKPSRRAASAW
ncbi:hypothetical protein GCM10023238_10960 [Streptomyces heliomycini]